MDGAAIIEQLMTTEVRTDPYPLYARAHELGPVLPAGDGMFVVSGYAAVNKVLRTSAFGVATADMMAGLAPEFGEHSSLALFGRSILQRNAPDQPRVRSLIASVFTARRVAALRPAVEAAVGRLLDGMAEQGADGSPVDFMDAFAFRLPVGVICELLGVPERDRYRFRGLASDLTVALEIVQDLDDLDEADRAADELSGYFTELVAERLARPQDDLVSDLARIAADGGGRLSGQELLANLVLLLVAGFETTTNLLGNGLALLFRHPEAAAGLRSGTLSPTGFTDEVLRFDSPVQATGRAVDRGPARPGRQRADPADRRGQPRPGPVRAARGVRPDPHGQSAAQFRRRHPLLSGLAAGPDGGRGRGARAAGPFPPARPGRRSDPARPPGAARLRDAPGDRPVTAR